MSDSLASESTLERPSQGGQVERASDTKPQEPSGGQPSDNGKAAQVDENIKNLQRKLSEKDLDTKRALQEAQQARSFAQQLQQRLQQLEDSAAPDDYARLELRAKRAEEAAQYYANAHQQAIAAQQAEQEKQKILRELAEELEVDLDDIKDATDWKSAAKLAAQAKLKREQQRQRQDDDRRERNMPDLGGGAPTTANSKWEAEYEAALKARDSVAQARLLRQRGG